MKRILATLVLLFGIHSAFAKDVAGFTKKHECVTRDARSLTCKVVKGDTLSQDALDMYGNGHAYATIKNANAAKIVDANKIYADGRIIIPIDPATAATATPSAPRDSRASSTGDALAATAASPTNNRPTTPEATSPIEEKALAMTPSVETDATPVLAATPSTESATTIIQEAASPQVSSQPLTLSQPKGWYKITVNAKNFPHAGNNARMYRAVFVDNPTDVGTWRYRKEINVIVEKDNDVVTILVHTPKNIETNSTLAVGNIFLERNDIASKGQRIPAPDLKHLAVEKNPDIAAQERALHAGYVKQQSTGKLRSAMGHGLLAAGNAAAIFMPILWIPVGVEDARFVIGKMEKHSLDAEQHAQATLQQINEKQPAAPEQQ